MNRKKLEAIEKAKETEYEKQKREKEENETPEEKEVRLKERSERKKERKRQRLLQEQVHIATVLKRPLGFIQVRILYYTSL